MRLIIKERKIPIIIHQLQALLRRLPVNHPKRPMIEEDLAKRLAGYRGEQSLDYHLRFLDQDQYKIFHDLRLINQDAFQIDVLLLSSYFVLLLEVKNISGTLFFDKYSNQLIRTLDGIETGFSNPVSQVKRQTLQFQNWLEKNKYKNLPVEYLIIISNPSTVLKKNPGNHQLFKRVVHSELLMDRIKDFELIYKNEQLEKKDLRKLSKLLLQANIPLHQDIFQYYNLTPDQLILGVQCPSCRYAPMERAFARWYCTKCQTSNKDAHIQVINDYFYLIKRTITNRECQQFLKISSRNIAHTLLTSMNLPTTGSKKSTQYHQQPQ
ncbi:nuclease-related domain-containing protein [Cytobacillus sp. FJAT-54145]|uniref:Nuclease-related domain-containing protein n=1 Tax=Cytobacillus spartinae TaxID=3299023 RepID=A0ABW6KCG4_9BACI